VIDLCRNLRNVDQESTILLYNGGDDALDACRYDAFGAGPGSPGVAARLERADERRASSQLPGGVERMDFRVWRSCALVIAVANNDALVVYDDGAHHRIGTGASSAAFSQASDFCQAASRSFAASAIQNRSATTSTRPSSPLSAR
jgi:hypothetical protein